MGFSSVGIVGSWPIRCAIAIAVDQQPTRVQGLRASREIGTTAIERSTGTAKVEYREFLSGGG